MANPAMHKMAYPIETEEAYKFWASKHKCNRIKAIIAFSKTLEDANSNLRRFGFPLHLRRRAIHAWQHFVAMPDMIKVPFTPLTMPWWECLPLEPTPPPSGRWAIWLDDTEWEDTSQWQEWIDTTTTP